MLYFGAISVLLEAESFANKDGRVTDHQIMDLPVSHYLMAHGIGVPVDDAFSDIGEYF